ncbi:MAG: helix-turn-helix transcriptional regulator [Myxococcales bacterium]
MNSVQRLREAQLLGKAELARRAGISESTIDRIEAGHGCRMETKRKILFALGLALSDGPKVFKKGSSNHRKANSKPMR